VLHEDRRRARSFGADAVRYDRARPDYPLALLEAVGANEGQDVLDVGCGTGIAGRLFARQGCAVLGVEPDPRMAAVARATGLSVEISSFEEWDPRGRLFDVVASGQAWHWIDPDLGASKAAAVLRPAGAVALFWNCGHPEPDLKAAFDDIYRRVAPGVDSHSIVLGHPPDDRFEAAAAAIDQTGLFGPVRRETHSWEKVYVREEWLDHLPTHSDHQGLPADELGQLLEEVANAIDHRGGSFAVRYDTILLTATRRDSG
jgi:SAM-dependent methyltransferase